MLKFDIYAIETDNDERSRSIKELFTSFDDAMNARYKYANWFCQKEMFGLIFIKQIVLLNVLIHGILIKKVKL